MINHLVGRFEDLHIEIDETFEGELFWSQNIKKDIQAVTLVELVDFVDKFILHRKG